MKAILMAILNIGAGIVMAVHVVAFPHYGHGNLWGSIVGVVASAAVVGILQGILFGNALTGMTLLFLMPALFWELLVIYSGFKVGFEWRGLAIWTAQFTLGFGIYYLCMLVGSKFQKSRRSPS